MKQVEMPIIDQYVRLLILKSRLYQLEDSEYVIIADYDHSQCNLHFYHYYCCLFILASLFSLHFQNETLCISRKRITKQEENRN